MFRRLLQFGVVGVAVAATLGVGPDFLQLRLPAQLDYHAEWAAYLAPEQECPGGEDESAPVERQQETMLCLLNWARAREGLRPLPASGLLMRSAAIKAGDMVSCDEFAHAACGRSADAGARSLGYGGSFGENISWGTGPARAPKPTVDGWLASPGHRANLFRPGWGVQGIALLRAPRYQGKDEAAVWVSQFGG